MEEDTHFRAALMLPLGVRAPTRLPEADAVRRALAGSVKVSTHNRYVSEFINHREAGYESDFIGLRARMAGADRVYSASTYANWIAGIDHCRRLNDLTPFTLAERQDLHRVAAGRIALDGEKPPPRGAIVLADLRKIITWLKANNRSFTAEHEMYLYLAYGCAGRTSEMASLKLENFTRTGGGYILTMDRIHDPTLIRGKYGVPTIDERIVRPVAVPFLDVLLRAGQPEDLLAPNWKAAEINNFIQAGAVGAGLDMNYKYVGHSLRHGAAVDAAAESGLSAAQAALGHRSASTTAHYARTNAHRGLAHKKCVADTVRHRAAVDAAMLRGLCGPLPPPPTAARLPPPPPPPPPSGSSPWTLTDDEMQAGIARLHARWDWLVAVGAVIPDSVGPARRDRE